MAPVDNSDYDVIFAGGGTSACVIAGRLAAAAPDLRILIIENGSMTRDDPDLVRPGRWSANMANLSTSAMFTVHETMAGDAIGGRSLHVSNGSRVGGSGSLNGMMYNRAVASDYDDWMRLGNPGWGSEDLISLAKKCETFQAGAVSWTHGASGPIKVSSGGYETRGGRAFLSAANEFPRGRGFTEDINDFMTCDEYGRFPKYIDAETGRRSSDTAHNYLYAHIRDSDSNVHILTHAHVHRVMFDAVSNRAVGVAYQLRDQDGVMCTANATRLVVVSAGIFGSPAILERSGIGGRQRLEKLGIPIVSDLPGVGENYNDHVIGCMPFKVPDDEVTMETAARDEEGVFTAQWEKDGTGPLSTNYVDVGIKLRPTAIDLEAIGPQFSERWQTHFAKASDRCVFFLSLFSAHTSFTAPTERGGMNTLTIVLTHPMSVGSVHISSRDAFTPLLIDCKLFERSEDLILMRWGYKWTRELLRRMPNFRGEYPLGHPNFHSGSAAACLAEAEGPVEINTAEIKYSAEDDEAIDQFFRDTATAVGHSLGTCAMKPLEALGVVDPRLNVYGVSNLKVADMSIAPANVGANTYNTAVIIEEKAALLIAEELGIEGV